MQDVNNLEFAKEDPKGFLNENTNEYGIIIDEAQYAPILFNQIKVEIDKNRNKMSRYVLSGSQNFLLSEKITESLAGRIYIYTLLPLSIKELSQNNLLNFDLKQQIIKGFYPGLYSHQSQINRFYESYFYTYVERDVRNLRKIEDLSTFKKFIQRCIARIGQPLNLSSLANESKVNVLTAKAWISILEASYILYLLPSYHNNLSKRVVKSPKIFFYDVGLAANIANMNLETLKERREILGQFFENMIITDLKKEALNRGLQHQFYFYRDVNLKEIDLIADLPNLKIPIEIKLSETLQSKFFKNINWLNSELNLRNKNALIYSGDKNQQRTNTNVYSWFNDYKVFNQ